MSVFDDKCRMFRKTGSEEEKPQKLRLFGILKVTKTHGFTALFIIVVAGKRREHQVIDACLAFGESFFSLHVPDRGRAHTR